MLASQNVLAGHGLVAPAVGRLAYCWNALLLHTEVFIKEVLISVYQDMSDLKYIVRSFYRKTVVCPVVDIISSDTLVYKPSPVLRGGFNWGLHFAWEALPKQPEVLRSCCRRFACKSLKSWPCFRTLLRPFPLRLCRAGCLPSTGCIFKRSVTMTKIWRNGAVRCFTFRCLAVCF